MVDGLAAIAAGIDHEAVAALDQSLFLGNLDAEAHHLTQHRGSISGMAGCGGRCDMLHRDYQNVSRCLGREIAKGDRVVTACDDVGGDLPRCDPAEDAVHGGKITANG